MPVSSVPLSETHTSGRPRDDGLELAQDRDDLLFGEPAPLHPPSPNPGYGLYPFWRRLRGSGQMKYLLQDALRARMKA